MVKLFVVVAYDIPSDRVRTRVCNELKSFGSHVQLSVFECVLSEAKYQEMKERLEELIEGEEALVRFYKMCQACVERSELIGCGEFAHDVDIYVA